MEPASTKMMAIADAKIGRWMKNPTMATTPGRAAAESSTGRRHAWRFRFVQEISKQEISKQEISKAEIYQRHCDRMARVPHQARRHQRGDHQGRRRSIGRRGARAGPPALAAWSQAPTNRRHPPA